MAFNTTILITLSMRPLSKFEVVQEETDWYPQNKLSCPPDYWGPPLQRVPFGDHIHEVSISTPDALSRKSTHLLLLHTSLLPVSQSKPFPISCWPNIKLLPYISVDPYLHPYLFSYEVPRLDLFPEILTWRILFITPSRNCTTAAVYFHLLTADHGNPSFIRSKFVPSPSSSHR